MQVSTGFANIDAVAFPLNPKKSADLHVRKLPAQPCQIGLTQAFSRLMALNVQAASRQICGVASSKAAS